MLLLVLVLVLVLVCYLKPVSCLVLDLPIGVGLDFSRVVVLDNGLGLGFVLILVLGFVFDLVLGLVPGILSDTKHGRTSSPAEASQLLQI